MVSLELSFWLRRPLLQYFVYFERSVACFGLLMIAALIPRIHFPCWSGGLPELLVVQNRHRTMTATVTYR